MQLHALLVLASWLAVAFGAVDLGFGSDDDLTNFVSRSDLKVPRMIVDVHDRDKVTPVSRKDQLGIVD